MSMSKLDASQVIKSVYSPDDGALRTVPSAATSFSVELSAADGDSAEVRPMAVDVTTLLNAVPAQTAINSAAVEVLNYRIVSLLLTWVDLDAADSTATFQGSVDGTIWHTIGAATTLSIGAGSALHTSNDCPYKQVRLAYFDGANTVGTVTAKYILKG